MTPQEDQIAGTCSQTKSIDFTLGFIVLMADQLLCSIVFSSHKAKSQGQGSEIHWSPL